MKNLNFLLFLYWCWRFSAERRPEVGFDFGWRYRVAAAETGRGGGLGVRSGGVQNLGGWQVAAEGYCEENAGPALSTRPVK